MSEIKDSRFARVHSDPHYMRQPKKDRKIALDNRFKGMLTDKRFSSSAKFDKHGRKVTPSKVNKELKELYETSDQEDKEVDEEEIEEESAAPKKVVLCDRGSF